MASSAAGDPPSSEAAKQQQLQIRLLTTQEDAAVPSTALSVPADVDPAGLNQLVHGLLKDERDDYDESGLEGRKFDFLLGDDFVRGTLREALKARRDLTEEQVLEVRYTDARPPPEPQGSVNHDDWVAGVASSAANGHVLTACYDNTVNVFSLATGEKRLTIPGHGGPVRAVAWLEDSASAASAASKVHTFASGSHDQTVMLYRWNSESNEVEAVNSCRGHERSVDCLDGSPSGSLLASGSFDGTVKVWGAKVVDSGDASAAGGEDGGESKRSKTEKKVPTRTPVMTLGGHKEGVSGVAWMGSDAEVASCSWDHTIKVWDCAEMRGMKTELVGDRSFFALDYSPRNGTIVTASADSAVRLYDPRASQGVLVQGRYTSHTGWVTSVSWCSGQDDLFCTCGHDTLVKLWDRRACRTPLFDLRGHEDRALSCHWGAAGFVASGGADNALKIFRADMGAKG